MDVMRLQEGKMLLFNGWMLHLDRRFITFLMLMSKTGLGFIVYRESISRLKVLDEQLLATGDDEGKIKVFVSITDGSRFGT
jgi:hypothetical protein